MKISHALGEIPEKLASGDETVVQIAPFGDWPTIHPDGSTIIQTVDRKAVETLVANFSSEILVDADHRSEKGGSTAALAWVTKLVADPERGLVGVFRWTDAGAEAVTGRRYRFVSASWTLDNDGRPDRLLSVALTNRPNIPAKPILNSVQVAPATKEENKPKGSENMEKLRELLGLAETATEEEILAAVEATVKELAELKQQNAEEEAEEFAKQNEDKVDNPEILKNAYLTDPELAKKIVANIRPAAPRAKQKVLNSQAALTPKIPRIDREGARAEMAALPPSKRGEYYQNHKDLLD